MKTSLTYFVVACFIATFSQGAEPERDRSAPKGGWIAPTAEELKKVD